MLQIYWDEGGQVPRSRAQESRWLAPPAPLLCSAHHLRTPKRLHTTLFLMVNSPASSKAPGFVPPATESHFSTHVYVITGKGFSHDTPLAPCHCTITLEAVSCNLSPGWPMSDPSLHPRTWRLPPGRNSASTQVGIPSNARALVPAPAVWTRWHRMESKLPALLQPCNRSVSGLVTALSPPSEVSPASSKVPFVATAQGFSSRSPRWLGAPALPKLSHAHKDPLGHTG